MVFPKFTSFSVRPPTPPKDLKDINNELNDALQFLDDPFGTKQFLDTIPGAKALPNTPVQSPSSETGDLSSASRKKRVNFELQTCTIPTSSGLITQQPWTPRHSSPLRPLPQTRVSKPLKSILKASDPASTPPPTDEGAAAHKFQSFAEMLESVVKMLAQGARPSKLDAYISLQRTMQAYDKLPDIEALANKMGLFSQFIRRDMQAVGINGAGPDSQLIQQALKFLMVLVRIPELKPAMDDEFCSFVVDRIITVTADATMPKTIINTHLALLMQQNFRAKVMTVARVEKVLDALDNVHERVTGYSVQAYRIRVYRKFIQQHPKVMIKHTERWFKHVLKAMLSGQKDIHQSALETAISAAKAIGSDRYVTKSVLSILNRVKSDGESFGKHFAQELERSLTSDSAPLVPQIWGTLTAFLQESLQESTFSATREWLKVLEKLFSSENDAVRANANIAFNFLVYAVNITDLTPVTWSKMLLNISQHQLGRRSQSRKTDIDTATSAYLTLLYYSLRPTASHTQLDRYWSEFVAEFWSPLVHSSAKHAFAACRVVSVLFSGSRKPWNDQRALELKSHLLVQRGELPLLDPKWVRKALAAVLKFVETLLDAAPWASDVVDDEPVKTMWIALLDSLLEASSKEVMATTETKDAIAHTVNMLRRMWDRHTAKLASSQQKEDSWADKFCFLIETVVQKLGAFQFADKCLTRNAEDEFELAPTPSHRSRLNGTRVSPLLYFIDLLVSRSEGKLSDPVRLRVIRLILEPCFDVQNTRLAKLELLRDCSTAVSSSSKNVVALNFWDQVATLTESCIKKQPSDSSDRIPRQLGKEYEAVVEILALGSPHLLNAVRGQDVLSTFVATVRREAGEGAVVLAVIERVSECVLVKASHKNYGACLPYASILLMNLPKSIIRRTLEQGRQNLFPSSPASARSQEFDPYSHFYSAIVSIGSAAYYGLEINTAEHARDFIVALAASIRQSPISLLAVYLRKTQHSIKLWIEDSDRKLQKDDLPIKQLHHEVINLWQTVSGAIERLPRKDSSILVTLEPLITAGFMSRRRAIVNLSIATWNATFGKEENLRYPTRLEEALQLLRNAVELTLPSFPPHLEDSSDHISFYDSDSSGVDTPRHVRTPRVRESPSRVSKSTQKSRSPGASRASGGRASSRRAPKIRLRHENSQIQFEPIISSPSNPFQQESQVLTERQKEMIERQRIAAKIFSNMGPGSASQEDLPSSRDAPQELHSDAISADDLPVGGTRTPSKALAAMGPMNVYLGSSPTPSARNRSQQIRSDETSVATPNAVRTVQLAEMEDLGSSPPRFEKDVATILNVPQNKYIKDHAANDSFDYREPVGCYSESFDDGTTVDEEILPEVGMQGQPEDASSSDDELLTDNDPMEVPSSTVELQLNAQLDAELDARHESSATNDSKAQIEPGEESNNVYVDAASQQLLPATFRASPAETDTQVEETQIVQPGVDTDERAGTGSSDTSRVGDSFYNDAAHNGSQAKTAPQVQNIRRSSRNSASFSPGKYATVRKYTKQPVEGRSETKKNQTDDFKGEEAQGPEPLADDEDEVDDEDEDMHDCIVVAIPDSTTKRKRGSSKSQTPAQSSAVVPETARKWSVRRSTSLLSQVETHTDGVLVEDTPAPKRARKETSQDVSEAKSTRLPGPQVPQAKRVSHVQVTPKHSPSSHGSALAAKVHDTNTEKAPVLPAQASSVMGEQKANAAPQIQGDTTPKRSFAERVILTPKSLLGKLRSFIADCSQMVLGREEERQLDDAMFDLRLQIHAAGLRRQERQQ